MTVLAGVRAALALAFLVALPAPLRADCSTTDLEVAASGEDLSTVEGVLRLADKAEAMALGRDEECREKLFHLFLAFSRRGQALYAQKNGLASRRPALLAEEREKELAELAAGLSRVGWAVEVLGQRFSLSDDPGWMIVRYGEMLPPSWREYLPEAKAQGEAVGARGGARMLSPATLTIYIRFWEGFLARFPGTSLRSEVDGLLGQYRAALPKPPPPSTPK